MSLVAEYQELEKVHGLCQRCYRSVSEQWQNKIAKFRQSLELLDGVVVVDSATGGEVDSATGGSADSYRMLFDRLCIKHQDDIESFFNGGGNDDLPPRIIMSGLPFGNGVYELTGSDYTVQTAPSWWYTPTVYKLRRIFGRWQLCKDTTPVGVGKVGSDHSLPTGVWSGGGQAQPGTVPT